MCQRVPGICATPHPIRSAANHDGLCHWMWKFDWFIKRLCNDPTMEIKMKFLTSAFTLVTLIATPAAAVVYSDTMNDHNWTRQAHVEDITGSRGGSKDHSRVRN
jgi:hypothetical protein